MPMFKHSVSAAFGLMCVTSMAIMFSYSGNVEVGLGRVYIGEQRHLTRTGDYMLAENVYQDRVYHNEEPQKTLGKIKSASTRRIVNESRVFSSRAVDLKKKTKLIDEISLTKSQITRKNPSINHFVSNATVPKFPHTIRSKNVSLIALDEPSDDEFTVTQKHKIRIVLYHFYHTLLKSQAKKLDMKKCHHSSNCEIVYQGKCSNEPIKADAVVFQGNNIPNTRPKRLHSKQVFVFLTIESPQYLQTVRLSNPFFNTFFNWTMTYKRDSDIPYLYGSVVPRSFNKYDYLTKAEKNGQFVNYDTFKDVSHHDWKNTGIITKNYTAIFRNKTKSSVWMVSHCATSSKRERYVSQMRKYTDIDVFGRCSSQINECPKMLQGCGSDVARKYKFYLAFENSLCEDYITEKVFKWFGEDTVVVVRGARYYKRYLPTGTYIDADDFASPEDMARYLTKLGGDEEEYLKYLKKKDNYSVISETEHVQLAYCNLCYKLNNLDFFRKPAKNLHQWWNVGKCTKSNIH